MKGDVHRFGHLTLIGAGKYRCQKFVPILDANGDKILADGKTTFYAKFDQVVEAPCFLDIEPDCHHSFECLEDGGILWCLFAHRDPQSGEVTQMPTGWTGAYG